MPHHARAPPLFISGGEDHLMPPSVQRSDARHYRWNTVTEVKEDHALDWAVQHASAQPTAGRRH